MKVIIVIFFLYCVYKVLDTKKGESTAILSPLKQVIPTDIICLGMLLTLVNNSHL